MSVIRLVVPFVEGRAEVDAHALERCAQHLPHPSRDHTSAGLGCEDQMYMQLENDVSAATKLT